MPPRFAKRTDANQAEIVEKLRSIPGVTVQTDHDDILVGFRKKTYWFEVKRPEIVGKVSGKVRRSGMKKSQLDLLESFTGHYAVVWNLDQILREIGVTR